jgi:hypothetical protein
MRYLATLLLPPEAYAPRRMFVPFGGVASEVTGAGLAGWEQVDAVELDPAHVDIGRKRAAYWLGKAAAEKASELPFDLPLAA